MLLFLTFLAYKSLQLRGGHFVYLSRLNENWRVITRTNFLAMRKEKHCTNPMFGGKVRTTNRDKHKRRNSKGAEGKALPKAGVCEAKHAKHENARVQNSKENRGASTAQTRSL